MKFVPGLSYGAFTGSLAYPMRPPRRPELDHDMLRTVLDMVHPGQFNTLPPSPGAIISKAELMGVATYKEFWK